jgi:hypothetical protein
LFLAGLKKMVVTGVSCSSVCAEGNNLLLPKVWQQVDVSTIQRMGSSTSPFFLRQAIYTLPLQRKP